MAITKANRAYEFEQYTAQNVEALFTLLFELDLQIEESSILLNKAQPQVSGKLSVHFGANQKLFNGTVLYEPYAVKLIMLKAPGGKHKWRMRRLTQQELGRVNHKLEKLLPKRTRYKKSGYTITPSFENQKQTVAVCRLLDKLFEARLRVKKSLSQLNLEKRYASNQCNAILSKTKLRLANIDQSLSIDFSQPDIAYALIKQKQMGRIWWTCEYS